MKTLTKPNGVVRVMRTGAKLVLRAYIGYCLRRNGRIIARVNTALVHQMERGGIIQRIDDRTTRCGKTYELVSPQQKG
jgi:hypothetical protein